MTNCASVRKRQITLGRPAIQKLLDRGWRDALAKILKKIQENPIDWNNPSENEFEFYPDGTPTFRGLD